MARKVKPKESDTISEPQPSDPDEALTPDVEDAPFEEDEPTGDAASQQADDDETILPPPEDVTAEPVDPEENSRDSATGPSETDAEVLVVPAVAERKQRSGMGAAIFGGVIGAIIGSAGVYFLLTKTPDLLPQPDTSAMDASLATIESNTQTALSQTDALDARISSLEEQPAPQPTDLTEVTTALADLATRIETLEARPEPQAAPSAETTEAVDLAVADMRETLDAKLAELAAAQQAASEQEAAASAAQGRAEARAQLAKVQTAFENGQPFGDELATLDPLIGPAPADLAALEAGAPTLAALQESFPEAARAALAEARSETADDSTQGRVAQFFQAQLGVRSLEPREGDGADAILSRAEAAVKAGNLAAAIQELSALPASAAEIMQPWVDRASARLHAAEALAAYTAQAAE